MGIIDETKAVIQRLAKEWYKGNVAGIDILRLDRIHPIVSGNKWYKLKHNLEQVLQQGYRSVLTFGGAYSNHLIATAAAAKEYNIKSIGVVRGLHAENELTPTLQACKDSGMELVFVTREDYNRRTEGNWLIELAKRFDGPFVIPMGGENEWGRSGAEDIAKLIPENIYTHVCVSVGTGTTLIGVRNALPASSLVLGFIPMKGGNYLDEEINQNIRNSKELQLFDDWHFGGFGKWNDELINFMNEFYVTNHIQLDIVYTAKMMYGLKALIISSERNVFDTDSRILCIHTGGLQGNISIQDRLVY